MKRTSKPAVRPCPGSSARARTGIVRSMLGPRPMRDGVDGAHASPKPKVMLDEIKSLARPNNRMQREEILMTPSCAAGTESTIDRSSRERLARRSNSSNARHRATSSITSSSRLSRAIISSSRPAPPNASRPRTCRTTRCAACVVASSKASSSISRRCVNSCAPSIGSVIRSRSAESRVVTAVEDSAIAKALANSEATAIAPASFGTRIDRWGSMPGDPAGRDRQAGKYGPRTRLDWAGSRIGFSFRVTSGSIGP